jgi:hypothetical protein
MSIAELIYQHSRRLPDHIAREALDFIEFLEQRHGITNSDAGVSDDTESFLRAISSGFSDDFPDDITDDDLGVDAPRQGLD